MEWCQATEKTIDDLLVKVPPKNKQEIEMNVRIYDVSFTELEATRQSIILILRVFIFKKFITESV